MWRLEECDTINLIQISSISDVLSNVFIRNIWRRRTRLKRFSWTFEVLKAGVCMCVCMLPCGGTGALLWLGTRPRRMARHADRHDVRHWPATCECKVLLLLSLQSGLHGASDLWLPRRADISRASCEEAHIAAGVPHMQSTEAISALFGAPRDSQRACRLPGYAVAAEASPV